MEQRQRPVFTYPPADSVSHAAHQQQLVQVLELKREPLFSGADTTAGTENELAAVVTGRRATADLPRRMLDSPHIESLPAPARRALAQWLNENPEQVWEHSWLRIERARLHPHTRAQIDADLAGRPDRAEFEPGDGVLRLPASYVLRVALIDATVTLALPESLQAVARKVSDCFLNDNTAPEIISTHVVSGDGERLGEAVAGENAQRFLLTQLLVRYANRQFGLEAGGQSLAVYGAPNPPQRLKALSRLLPADHYRDLIMNPCLAGFSDGGKKRRYMHLCHETLSRSRQHAHARLIGAGIGKMTVIERLVCDTSLLNNGTHLSLGSRSLGRMFASPEGAQAEKYLGDLASKIIEHFLPLFVGLYSAAPARIAPADFKPEKALGFLPNELSAPFLRLTWASWKRKAGLLSALKGDFVPDARLLDYFAALPSLPGRASLDGQIGNGERLKSTLASQGLYHADMSVYALYRLRELAKMGFTGFEGRHYSLFPSFADDLGPATELQTLVTAFAYEQLVAGAITHADIPDDAETESERRQLFFASAVGVPVAYVRRHTANRFLLRLLQRMPRTRVSKRYPQYFKITLDDYRLALVDLLANEGAGLLDTARHEILNDLRARLAQPATRGAAGVITRGILDEAGASSADDLDAGTFNAAAERYYRNTLRSRQLQEGVEAHTRLVTDAVTAATRERDATTLMTVGRLTRGLALDDFHHRSRKAVAAESADVDTVRAWIGLVLVQVSSVRPA